MKKYRLLKDMPFTKAGEIFTEKGINEKGKENALIYDFILQNEKIEELIGEWIEEVIEEKIPDPKFRIGQPVKINNFFTKVKGLWAEKDGTFSYYIETLNPDFSIQSEKNLEKPTDYELGTYFLN